MTALPDLAESALAKQLPNLVVFFKLAHVLRDKERLVDCQLIQVLDLFWLPKRVLPGRSRQALFIVDAHAGSHLSNLIIF